MRFVRERNEVRKMCEYQYTVMDNTIQVLGHEDELSVLDFGNWENGKIKYYRSLLAHQSDMEYAEAYLNQMFFNEDTSLIDGALINSAIQLLIKSFSNPSGKGRRKLDEKIIFRKFARSIGEGDLTRQFSQFYNARNNVISHDQLNYAENIIGLVVNPVNGSAEDIAEIIVRTRYLYKQNQVLLLKMVHIVQKYLHFQIEGLKKSLIEEYNKLSEKPNLARIVCEDVQMSTAW